MAALPADLDPNDPINILLRPFDAIPKPAAAAAAAPADAVDPNAKALADAQASQDAAAAAEAERQRKLAEEKANILRQTTIGGKNNNTIFGGAEGEVVYESNVRPSGRRWESTNRVEVKRSVVDFNMSEPLPPEQMGNESAFTSLLSSSPVAAFSQPIQVEMVAPVAAAAPRAAITRASPVPMKAAVTRASPVRQVTRESPARQAASPVPMKAAVTRASPARQVKPAPAAAPAADSAFSPTAGVHPTTATGANKTEEFMKKVGGGAKVRQCPSFRMLEFQIQYEDYKQTKTAVS